MDCDGESASVNLCSEPECVNSAVTFHGTDSKRPHLPNHGMFKIYRVVFDRDMGMVENRARSILDSAIGIISQPESAGNPMPKCAHCKVTVPSPCWCCVDCIGERRLGI